MNTASNFPALDEFAEASIADRFTDSMLAHSDNVAVHTEAGSIKHGELLQRSRETAGYLTKSGVMANDHVAIVSHGNIDYIVNLVATLILGGVAISIDARLPFSRAKFMAADSGSKWVITDRESRPVAQSILGRNQALLSTDFAQSDPLKCPPKTGPNELAFIYYTSGSTGLPKGVMLNSATLLFDAARQIRDLKVTNRDNLSIISSISSTAFLTPLITALACGASVSLFDLKERGMFEMVEFLNRKRVSMCDLNTTAFRALASDAKESNLLPDLKVLALFGERVGRTDLVLFKRLFSANCRLQITLGLSESRTITQVVMGGRCQVANDPVSVGVPVDGKSVTIVDDKRNPLPIGKVGEVVVTSRYISTGYWNRPSLNHERFKHGTEGCITFATGDLGYFDDRGYLYLTGRIDFQLKVRGMRVEIEEVEARLRACFPGFHLAVVSSLNVSGESQLDAYLEDAKDKITVEEIRQRLGEELPDYMIPSRYFSVEQIPHTPSRKIDRPALTTRERSPIPLENRKGEKTDSITDTEKRVAQIFCEVLGLDRIESDTDLIVAGVDSICITKALSRIQLVFEREISYSEFFDCSTVEALSERIERVK